eukprot:5911039-Pleurochrysis_carterae.AAC.1
MWTGVNADEGASECAPGGVDERGGAEHRRVHMCGRACVRACGRAGGRAYVRACVRACVCACMRAGVRAC